MRKRVPPKMEIDKVQEDFRSWRETKPYSSSPIPEELWQEAVELARTYSIHEICKALHLDFNKLKRHVQGSDALRKTPSDPSGGFVELSLAMAPQPSECLIELERSDGMRLSIKGSINPPLLDLLKAFWSQS